MAVSFIGGGNRSTRRRKPTCRKKLINFITVILYRVHLAMCGIPELTTLVVIGTDQGRIQGGLTRSVPPPPPKLEKKMIFWHKIVIFHTKYPKKFNASLRSAQFFLSAPPNMKSWIRPC